MVFQRARVEGWASAANIDACWKLVADGHPEQALDKFVASDLGVRSQVHGLARSSFERFASLNDLQRLLAKLPIHLALTTNYDCLLERSGAAWAARTIRPDAWTKSILDATSPSMVKLYGDFEAAQPAILTRADLAAALAANPQFRKDFAKLFETRSFLFLGASIEGLLEDLEMLDAPRPGSVQHYCVTGIGIHGPKSASQLEKRFNIEVIGCDVLNIQGELKMFLGELCAAVEVDRSRPEPAIHAAI